MTSNRHSSNNSEEHPAFSQIHEYVQGQLGTVEMQLCGHHIMHCHRCEAIWEQLIRKARQEISKTHKLRGFLNSWLNI